MKIPIKDIKIETRDRKEYGDIDGMAASLARYGLIQPVVLDDENRLLAGGRRLAGAVHLGWNEIEYIIYGQCDEITRKEIEAEENLRRKDLTWVEEVCALKNLYELRAEKYSGNDSRFAKSQVSEALGLGTDGGYTIRNAAEDLDRSVGSVSTDIQLARALDEFPDLKDEATKSAAWKRFQREKALKIRAELAKRDRVRAEQATPHEPDAEDGVAAHNYRDQPPGRSPQDVHQQIRKAGFKGKGTIYLADSRDVLRLLVEKGVKFDSIVTDPPFGLGMFKAGQTTTGARLAENEGGMYDDDPHKIMEMLDQVFMHAGKLLKPDGHAYVFFHMTRYEEIFQMLRNHFGTCEETPLIWAKNTPAIGDPNRMWVYSYEPCFWINRGRPMVKPQAFNVLRFDTIPPSQKIHPTMKPAALLRHIIQASCIAGETVLDPFCGSGSTLVAAAQLGCHFVGVEREEAFYRKACEYIAEELASEATHKEIAV